MKRALLIGLAFVLPFTSQAQDKFLDDQGRVITREQAEAANRPELWRDIVSISPDGHWLLCFRHYGSHWSENYLYRSDDGVRFVPARKESDKKELQARRQYAASEYSNASYFETAEAFDKKAWNFARAVEHIKVTKPVDIYPAEFVSWSSDSAKLLFSLTGRLNATDNELTVDPYARNDRKKPGAIHQTKKYKTLLKGLCGTWRVMTPLYRCVITTTRAGITIRATPRSRPSERTSNEI
jgi:hypothetical protein